MFQNKSEYINLYKCRSSSSFRNRNNRNLNNNNQLPNLIKNSKNILISKIQNHIRNSNLLEGKANTNILKKSIKISFNKYHKYIRNVNDKKNIINKRPISLYLNKKINNRSEIDNELLSKDYSYLIKNKDFSDTFNSNSNSKRTLFSSKNNSQQKMNLLNIGINSPINKNSSFNIININSFDIFLNLK